MKFFDTFTGIGGFTKGILDIIPEAECVGFSEVDKYAIQTYLKHYPNHKNYGDITKLNTADLPDFDILVGGFPCQSFSVAGRRQGFDDTRGTLFFDLARILKDKRPRHFIFENVKGLLSHDSGKTFQTILKILTDLGYEYQWQILNSKNFGVPQNRERIYIVGHLRGKPKPKVFPITRNSSQNLKEYTKGQSQGNRVYSADGISTTLTSQAGGLGAKTGLYAVTSKKELNRNFVKTDVFGALTATYYKGIKGDGRPAVAVLSPDRVKKRQNGRRFKTNGEPAFTLTSQDRHGVYNGYRIRRLTPLECERLQGFPDNWTEGCSDTQRYKQCGNAVTVNVVREIVKRLIK